MEGVGMTPSFWKAKRVFLTGHTGFKGSWLSLWLTRLGASVGGFALDPPTEPSLFELCDVAGRLGGHRIADIRDLHALRVAMRAFAPEIVIHMAAQPLVRASYADPVGTYSTNVIGTVNLLEAVRATGGVKAVLVVTSDKCYEPRRETGGYREGDPLGGFDPYSSSKACAEIAAAAYRRSFFGSDGAPALATARAGNVIGGGDWADDRLVPDIIRGFCEGQKPLIRSPQAVRPWQHVLEPLSGYLTVCEALVSGLADAQGAWNFGPAPSDARPVAWVADRLAQLWGEGAAWRTDAAGNHPHEEPYLYLDTAKAASRLGYRPRWNLEAALVRVVSWYRAWAGRQSMAEVTLAEIAAFEAARSA